MCLACQFSVNPTHSDAPFFNRVPCGHCKSCNEVYQKSWSFRLRVELDHLVNFQHWQVGFLTLTYNDMSLPHFPRSCFKNPDDYQHIQCFNRDQCESFIRSARSWLWREYRLHGAHAVRYMLASEFGSSTRRSHYHVVFCVPPYVDMRALYNKLKSLWVWGFVFPRYFEGGKDSHGYYHKGFVCENPSATAKYVAKYTTKDVYYNEHLQDMGVDVRKDMNFKSLEFRRLAPFHLQSKSLGASLLDGLQDSEKMELLKNGYSFLGDDKIYTLPVYFKNKLIYDNVYSYEYITPSLGQTGEDDIVFAVPKRVVTREANAFFIEHYRELYELKVQKYKDLFTKFSSIDEYRARGVLPEVYEPAVEHLRNFQKSFNCDLDKLARHYLSHYGVMPTSVNNYFDLPTQWLGHYCDIYLMDWGIPYDSVPMVSMTPDEVHFYGAMCCVVSHLFNAWYNVLDEYTDEDRMNDKLRDYFGHLT